MATPSELYEEFLRMMDTGDEATVRAFVIEHFNEFPEETQEELATIFIEEALEARAGGIQARAALQDDALKALAAVESEEKELADQARIEELKGQLGAPASE